MASDAAPPHLRYPPGLGRQGRAIVTAAVALAWLILSVGVTLLYAEYRRTEARSRASVLAVPAGGALSSAVNQRLALVRGLAAFVSVKAKEHQKGEFEREFPIFAAAYHQKISGIRNISAAPDFVTRYVYPPASGNLRLVGHNLLEDNRPGFADAVRRAISTHGLIVHEPVESVQGGRALLARHAVYVDDNLWGAVGMLFSIEDTLDAVAAAVPSGFAWAVRTAAGNSVGGDPRVFAMDPVQVTVDLPDGAWELALAPSEGWERAAAEGIEPQALRILLLLVGMAVVLLSWTALSRRAELERLVDTRTRALRAAHSELERFSFVVAHDLQEPLRSIMSFSQLVERGLSADLSDEQRDWLHGLSESARRMRALLHDVQVYLGEHDAPLPRKTIPAEEALGIARRKLAGRLRDSDAVLEVGILPHAWADHHRLSEIFLALIGNAVEYRSPDRPPRIAVTGSTQGRWVVIDVADNGIGIEEAYFDRIFEVFQRLHSRSAHPGTGMGLAIAKKMAEHLGGTIRVRSAAGQGSVFSVILPSSPEWEGGDRWGRS